MNAADMWTVATSLADSPIPRWFAGCLIASAILAALILLLRPLLRWSDEQVERQVQAALATEANDWGEPTRAQVDWDLHVAEAVALAETPIYAALSREQFVSDAMAEIDALTGGAAS